MTGLRQKYLHKQTFHFILFSRLFLICSIRADLYDHVASLAPVTSHGVEVPFLNILIAGQIGSGKSSFFNSLDSVIKNRVSGKAS